ncbi:hypothetical protein BJX61DRAFT_531779 [Aspergillus egyptiacus]|nr:hypothetical protein BJX61DRAFT_531779 [Aspergillus egyptiacus]
MTLRGSNRSTWRPALDVARLRATYACPFSKTLPRSTFTRCNVWPCALWMERAHARISGTCCRCAWTSPFGSSIFHVSGWQRRCRSEPSGWTKHTKGHLRVTVAPPSLWVMPLSFLRARAARSSSASSHFPPVKSFSFSM